MLDYAPDIATGADRGKWAVALGVEALSPDENLLLGLVAALRETDLTNNDVKRPAARRASYEFQPERSSGYCAST